MRLVVAAQGVEHLRYAIISQSVVVQKRRLAPRFHPLDPTEQVIAGECRLVVNFARHTRLLDDNSSLELAGQKQSTSELANAQLRLL